MVEMLPSITVVPDDAFNSSPTDPKLMGPDALQRFRDGQQLPSANAPTPLVGSRPLQARNANEIDSNSPQRRSAVLTIGCRWSCR